MITHCINHSCNLRVICARGQDWKKFDGVSCAQFEPIDDHYCDHFVEIKTIKKKK